MNAGCVKCGATDIPLIGYIHTWSNTQDSDGWTLCPCACHAPSEVMPDA